jgi:hypothetical protein
MTDIQPNAEGRIRKAKKQLRLHLKMLNNVDSLTADQRNKLFTKVLISLVRIQINQLGQKE